MTVGPGRTPSLPILDVQSGSAALVEVALRRPARLGATRLIAVDGPSGSGKTSLAAPLAAMIAAALDGEVITPRRVEGVGSADGPGAGTSSYSDPQAGGRRPQVAVVSTDLLATWEHPLDWWPVLERHLLVPIAAGRVARMPVMQWVSGNPRPGGEIVVPPVDVVVLEGVSAGRAAVADRLTALAWVEVPGAAERLERAVSRDGEAMRPFLRGWQIDEAAHFQADGTKSRADVLINPRLGE